MKIFGFLLSAVLAIDSTLLMLMMQQNSVQNPNQANQMNMMLPLLLLDDDKSTKSSDNKDLQIMMMMQGDNMGDMNSILPLLMLDDDSVDFKNFFLYSNMLKQGKDLIEKKLYFNIDIIWQIFLTFLSECATDTDSQFNMMLPMLLMGENNSTDSLMLMMMMQTMGNQPFNMEQVKIR